MIAAHDIRATASGLRPNRRGQKLAAFDACTVGVSRFSTHPRWERHPAGDELVSRSSRGSSTSRCSPKTVRSTRS